MASRWFYSKGGTQHGPATSEELKKLARAGTLAPGDLVWKEGTPEWVEARSVPGLLPEAASPPPLPPALPSSPKTWGHRAGVVVACVLGVFVCVGAYFVYDIASEGNREVEEMKARNEALDRGFEEHSRKQFERLGIKYPERSP